MQINGDRPNVQLNQPEHVPQQSSMMPVELSLLERLDKGFLLYEIAETELTVTGPRASDKYTGISTVIAQSGWLDVTYIIQYLHFGYIFKIVAGLALILNMFLFWQAWQYTCLLMACLSTGYASWNFAIWWSWKNSETSHFTEMFAYESIIGFNYTLFFLSVAYFFICSSWLMIAPALMFVCLIIKMIYSIKVPNSYFVHRASSLIEAIQIFGITMKLLKLTSLNWSYSVSFFMLSSLYYSVMGFVFLMIYCNMRYRGLSYHDFLPGMRYFGIHLMATGLVYQQLLGALPLIYTYPERLAEAEKDQTTDKLMDGKAQAVQACALLILANLVLLVLLLIQRSQIKYTSNSSGYSWKERSISQKHGEGSIF